MSRSYCDICRGIDDTGLGICSDCADESEFAESPDEDSGDEFM